MGLMKPIPSKFIKSAAEYEQCPPAQKPEFAFVGRSNVGKSSLINMLVGGRDPVANVSSKPGKTRLLNFFEIANRWNLVDLPGYGYAKVSRSAKDVFQAIVSDYILERETLKCVFQLIDSKIPPQQIDLDFSNWLMECGIPFVLVYTKGDKTKKTPLAQNMEQYHLAMSEFADVLPRTFSTSSKKGDGRTELLGFINQIVDAK